MSKGSRRRPRDPRFCSDKQFQDNFDEIDWNQTPPKPPQDDDDAPESTPNHKEAQRHVKTEVDRLEAEINKTCPDMLGKKQK
jgi:hypothetical protein